MFASQSKITDFNDGSVIMSIFEAVARIAENMYIETREGFNQNLRNIPMSVFDFKKKTGTKASTTVVFTRNSSLPTQSIIPPNTRISGGGSVFLTTAQGVINANETTSNAVPCQSEKPGLENNVAANTLTNIESIVPAEIVSVTNSSKATGGSNEETNNEFFERFRIWYNGLQGSNTYGIKSAALNVDGVRSVSLDEHFPTQQTYNATLYVDDGTGNLTESLKNKISDVINGDGTENNKGKRAVGSRIRILPATAINITVAVTVSIYRIDESQAIDEIKAAIQEEINGLGIGESVLLTSLILRLRRFSYVKDVSSLTINGSAANVTISANEIARFSNATITTVTV